MSSDGPSSSSSSSKMPSRDRQNTPPMTMVSSTSPSFDKSSAKAFINKYAQDNNLRVKYKTSKIGQKRTMYISILSLENKEYRGFPIEKPTPQEAEELVASKAKEDIERQIKTSKASISTLISNEELLRRIQEILLERPNGLWFKFFAKEYEKKFRESLPEHWLDVINMPDDDFYIEINQFDFDVNAFVIRLRYQSERLSLTNSMSLPSLSEFSSSDLDLCEKNKFEQYDVRVISVASTQNVILKFISSEFNDFCDMIDEFYDTHHLPVLKLMKNKMYATHLESEGTKAYLRVNVGDVQPDCDEVICTFVDLGMTKTLKIHEIQELDPSFCEFPVQSLTVKLNKLTEFVNFVRFDNLMTHLYDKTLVAQFVKRDEDGIDVVNLFDTSGNNDVNINTLLHDITIKELHTTSFPQIGSSVMANFVHISNNGEIYLRMNHPLKNYIESNLEQIAPKLEERLPMVPINASLLDMNVMYAAKINNLWYRAVIVDFSKERPLEAYLLCVDYGNCEWISTTQFCLLDKDSLLTQLPNQAICCSLCDVPPSSFWTKEAIETVKRLVPDNHKVIVKVNHVDKLPKVSLSIRNENSTIISINHTLAFTPGIFKPNKDVKVEQTSNPHPDEPLLKDVCQLTNLSINLQETSINPSHEKTNSVPEEATTTSVVAEVGIEPHNEPIPLPKIPHHDYFDVFVTCVSNPFNFVVQPIHYAKEFGLIQEEIQLFYSSEENICEMHSCLLKENGFYAVLNKDGFWYRACVINVTDEPIMATVQFVDFGDFALVDLTNIQPLYSKFKKLPRQAINARLGGVRPHLSDWRPEECFKFKELVEEKSFVSCVIKEDKTEDIGQINLELYLIDTSTPNEDVFIHKVLIDNKIARSS